MTERQNRGRLAYLVGGNAHAPRAKVVRVYTAEGPKDLVVGAQKISALLDTIIACGPSRIEAYEDDPPTRLLRAADVQADTGEAAEPEELEQTSVSREERLLSHFATLLSKAYADSHTAFKQLVRIAEHHATRAAAAERSVSLLHQTVIKQTQAMLREQAKRLGEDSGDGEIGELFKAFNQAKAMGEAAQHMNGAANGAPPKPNGGPS